MAEAKINEESARKAWAAMTDEKVKAIKEAGAFIALCLDKIIETDSKEVVEMLVGKIEKRRDEVNQMLGYEPPCSTRESIRLGYGDFAEIQDKCINMGVV